MHENQATDTLPDLLGAVPAIDSVDLKAPVVFTRQLAQPDRVHPSGLSLPIISRNFTSPNSIAKKCFLKCGDYFNSFYFVTRNRTGYPHEIERCQRLARNRRNSNWEAENPSEPKKES